MKKIILLALFIMVTTSAYIAAPVSKDYSLKLSSPGEPVEVEVNLYYGAITVEGYDGEVVEINAEFVELDKVSKSDHSDEEDMKSEVVETELNKNTKKKGRQGRSTEGLKRVTNNSIRLQIEEDDNEIDISSDMKNRLVKLHLRVPKRSALELSIYRGEDINISSIDGNIELSNYSGSIIASDISGPIVAETYRGEIIVDFNHFNDSNPTSFAAHNGSIDVSIPGKTKARVEVKTYRGEIFSGLESKFTPEDEQSQNNNQIVIGGLMAAEMNGGGQKITMSTFGGNIYIRKK